MRRTFPASMVLAVALVKGVGADAQTSTEELKRMNLQELLNIEVTTVSRQPEPTSLVPAAVYVITQDDIRRSGATSIPEALRLAPGIQVARIDAGKWAIGMRGFADRLARSMLVLMDGRAVYSPLFAGTYWEVQDTLMEDVERIEIIRGPGGTLWGANAVNGVINIITRQAKETQGVLVKGEAGTSERALAGFQFGGAAGSGHYRAYGKGFLREPEYHADGLDYDSLRMTQGGARGDWALSNGRTLTLQGDAYKAELGERATSTSYTPPYSQTVSIDAPLSGGNVLARLSGPMGERASFQLQTYYDRTNREEIPVSENRDTFDVDFQQRQRPWKSQQLAWGLGYRVTGGRITAMAPTEFVPSSRTDNLFSAFVQDDITIVPNRWRAGVGTKIEHNAYSGVEVQPSGRLLWTPSAANTVFWSVTRAVRTPSRVETDYATTSLVSAAVPIFVRLVPNEGFKAEELVAYETGYRVQPAASVYLTVSGFFNHLDNTLSTEIFSPIAEATPSPPHVVIPVQFGNGVHGSTHGVELTADVRPAAWWRWTTNYSYLHIAMSRDEGSRDAQETRYEGFSPRHQLQLQSSFDLPRRWSLDWLMRYVSAVPAGPVPSYATSTLRLAWQPAPALEIAVVGQDLHEAHHLEWPSGTGANVEIQRSMYVKVTWRR